jgi:hypothetical protein
VTCRSCNAEIIWTITDKGNRMPVDQEPAPDGNLVLCLCGPGRLCIRDGSRLITNHAHVASTIEGPLMNGEFHLSHFVTCPSAASHRRRK